MIRFHHMALHLAHRWFAFLEAPGGDLASHLAIFHPDIQLSEFERSRILADNHKSLVAWFAAVPDAVSSHHIIHSDYETDDNGDGLLNMVVAYQAPGDPVTRWSIISYETRVRFTAEKSYFIALDKTPILGNKRPRYGTSWSTNRVLARIHAELGGVAVPDLKISEIFSGNISQIFVQADGAEGSTVYDALVTCVSAAPAPVQALRLKLKDDVSSEMPRIIDIKRL